MKNVFPIRTALRCGTALAVLALALLAAGCTFSRPWRAAAQTPVPADNLTGRWQGTWRSDVNGHHGGLRCIVTELSPDTYRFFYDASYKRILHGHYTVTQTVGRVNGAFTLRGDAELPKMYGGHFEYEGTATPTKLTSTYRSKSDHGVFEMTRPGP